MHLRKVMNFAEQLQVVDSAKMVGTHELIFPGF
jgi:hypothetical protein